MTITISPPAPVKPGTFITICLTAPYGTVSFVCDPAADTPPDLDFSAESPCAKMYVPEAAQGLVAECPGHLAANIV